MSEYLSPLAAEYRARARAERAEAEVVRLRALADDPATNPYWRLRSTRAEAAEADLRAKLAEYELTQQAFEEYRASWSAATEATLAEVERLRATLERVRVLAAEWNRKCLDPADAFALSRNELLAVLDGTADAEGADRG